MLTRLHPLGPVSAIVLLVALSLTGCTPEPSNRPTTAIPAATTAPPPTPTAAPSTAAPEDPLDASLRVVRAYMDAYGPGFRAGDGSALVALVMPSCKTCANAIAKFDGYADAGPHRIGGDVHITKAEVRGAPTATAVTWHVAYTQDEIGIEHADGTREVTGSSESSFTNFEVALVADRWLIRAIRPDSSDAS